MLYTLKDYLKQLLTRSGRVNSLNTQDINLLALMCLYCSPVVFVKDVLFRKTYGYYIPIDKENIDFARALFKKNGIKAQKHDTRLISSFKQPALRVDLTFVSNLDNSDKVNFMRAIQSKHSELFLSADAIEKRRYWETVLESELAKHK